MKGVIVVINSRHGYKTRTVRCKECEHEFDQVKHGEDGCFSQAFWMPNECPNCGSLKRPEVPMILSIYQSDIEKSK